MGQVIWTLKAVKWLEEIHSYIAQDKPLAAQEFITSIYNKVELLGQFPEMGNKPPSETDSSIRILLHDHYRIVYQIQKNRDVIVLGVIHGSIEINKYLKK